MTERAAHTVHIHLPTENSTQDTTHHITTWNGTPDQLAAHYGAELGRIHRLWPAAWHVTVHAPDGATVRYTSDDENARYAARCEIVTRWEAAEREHRDRITAACAGVEGLDGFAGFEIVQAQISGVAGLLRQRAEQDLEDLGYRVLGTVRTEIIDERTDDGMLTLIRWADRQRGDHKDETSQWAATRDELIRAAHAVKIGPKRLSDATGLTTARIDQIVKKSR